MGSSPVPPDIRQPTRAPEDLELDGTPAFGAAAVALSADGEDLFVVNANGRHIVWPIGVDALVARACAVAGRQLTAAEWAEAIPDRPYQDVCPTTAAPGAPSSLEPASSPNASQGSTTSP